MLVKLKNSLKIVTLCTLLAAPIAALPTEKNSFGPISIDGYFSSHLHRQNKIKNWFDSIFSDLETMPLFEVNRFPFLSVIETKDRVTIRAELPGLDENEVKIDINDHTLMISGEKKGETIESKDEICHVCELAYGKFSRKIKLPFVIEANKTTASFAKGILTIVIQKPEGSMSKSQSIPINPKK